MVEERYDVAVVGGGPAGSAAAYTMAQKGMAVGLFERGKTPGSKNMFGGNIYARPTEQLFPAFWEEAPLERSIVREDFWFMTEHAASTVGFTGLDFAQAPYNKFSVLRSDFDLWMAEKAEEAGADLWTSTLVKDLIFEEFEGRKKVGGVRLDGGQNIGAGAVILAEGASAPLARRAGLRGKLGADCFTLYVKEVIALPEEKIEDRFGLEEGEGATIGMIGYPTAGAIGKGGIWTNSNTISLVVGAYLNQINDKHLDPRDLLRHCKKHPLIQRMIAGGEPLEYQAHTIPKGGYNKIPRLVGDGVLVVGDAAMMVNGRRGIDYAMLTGKLAGEAVAQARAQGSFDRRALASYKQKLENSFMMKDLRSNRKLRSFYKKHSDVEYLGAQMVNDISYRIFSTDLKPNAQKVKELIRAVIRIQPPSKTASDLLSALFSILA